MYSEIIDKEFHKLINTDTIFNALYGFHKALMKNKIKSLVKTPWAV